MKEKIFLFLSYLFTISLGFIAPISIDIPKVILCITLLWGLIFFRHELKQYLQQNTLQRIYVYGVLGFCGYGLLLVLLFTVIPNSHHIKPTFAPIENLTFTYLVYFLFSLLVAIKITQKQINHFVIIFIVGTTCSGLFLLYNYHGFSNLLNNPTEYFQSVFNARFMTAQSRFGFVDVFIKNYTFYPAFAAIFSLVFLFRSRKRYILFFLSTFLLNTFLIFFTLNRDGVLSLAIVIPVILIYYFFKVSTTKKLLLTGITILTIITIYITFPASLKVRLHEMTTESSLFFKEGHNTGSTSIRLTIWKTVLQHSPDFWLFGDGPVYANKKLHQYFIESGHQFYADSGFIHHNGYLYHFHHYGIFGLLFLLFFFLYPCYIMFKRKYFSITLCCIIIFFLLMLTTDTYLSKGSAQIILFWMYLFTFLMSKKTLESSQNTLLIGKL